MFFQFYPRHSNLLVLTEVNNVHVQCNNAFIEQMITANNAFSLIIFLKKVLLSSFVFY